MKVSIVVSTFRRPDALETTLSSLAALEYPSNRCEVIVVDDGSGDRTAEVVRNFASAAVSVVLVQQQNAGVARARNRGAEEATGEMLIFLDDDIVVRPDHIERHLAIHGRYDNCLVNGHWEFSPETCAALRETPFGRFRIAVEDWVKEGIAKRPLEDGLLEPSGITACNLSVRRELFMRLGGFDESFPHAGCEDQEFSYRAAAAGCRFIYDPCIELLHNDGRLTLRQFAQRQQRGALTFVYLVAQHPDAFRERPLLVENAPAVPGEPLRSRLKKAAKLILSRKPALTAMFALARVLERVQPDGHALHRVYKMTIGAHIFLGIRDGLTRHPEIAAERLPAGKRSALG